MIVVLPRPPQSGFALLMLLVALIGIASVGLSGLLSSSVEQRDQQRRQKNIQVLKQAKEALLSYAVNYAVSNDLNKMGKLPCPDTAGSTNNEGSQDINCGGISRNAIGYFPFKTLGLGKLEDAAGECLWYVVSGDYKNYWDADKLNWDSVGYLNLVDENNNLKHGSDNDEFPIALIIGPGVSLGQNRTADTDLPNCKSNYDLVNYMEGGPNIDYSADLPAADDTLWTLLTTSESAYLKNPDYNDQVISIYKDEIWERIQKLDDLSFDNSAGQPANSAIELLTKKLADCIAEYGLDTPLYGDVPFPAPIALTDYRVNNNYSDDASLLYGRYPQIADNSTLWSTYSMPLLDPDSSSYCKDIAGVLDDDDEKFWENWKDHFFYIVSEDYRPDNFVLDTDNCSGTSGGSSGCIRINSSTDRIAAMVIFAGEKLANQDRVWWWDDATSSVSRDDKADRLNYLEGDNQIQYVGGFQNYNVDPTIYAEDLTDYAYCIKQHATPPYLRAEKCADIL